MIEDTDQGLRVKASAKFIERIAKHPDGWNLVKGLSERKAEVQEMTQGIGLGPIVLFCDWHLVIFSLNMNRTFLALEFCPTLLAFGPLLTLYSCILLLW
jgi:hypothetical protein